MLQSTLDEGRRREYLAALGVPLFRVRRELPGAAASVAEVVPVAAFIEPVVALLPPAMQARALLAATASVAAPVILPESESRPEAAPVAPVQAAGASVAAVASVAITPQPRFACRLMPLGEQGFVLLDLGTFPDVVAGEILNLPSAEQQLWRNLQRALAWYPGEPEPDFIWPRAVKGMLGDDAATARDMLSAWLKRQIQPQARLWVFGEALAPFVTRPHCLLPSLSALLASPLAKRQVWQQFSQSTPAP
ncbi:MAG: hypothetical protein V4730_07070 [Pseudomonadota bacterium]